MVDFLHYDVRRHAAACTTVVAKKPAAKPVIKETAQPVEKKKKESKKEKEMTAQVGMAESTSSVMQEENITIAETDTVQEVVKKVRKSKKLHAKVSEDGSEVRVKQVLKD